LIKSLANVKFYKDLNINNLGKRFIDQEKQMLVFLYKAIKLIIVYTKAQAAVRLSYKEHRKSKGKAIKYNKPFIKGF
jgi:hypothetical protein